MKDSVTSGPLSKEQNAGGETSGFGGQPALSMMGKSKVYMLEHEDTRVEGKPVPMTRKIEKRELVNGSYCGIFVVVQGILYSY